MGAEGMTKETLFGILDGLEKVERSHQQRVSVHHAHGGVVILMSHCGLMQ